LKSSSSVDQDPQVGERGRGRGGVVEKNDTRRPKDSSVGVDGGGGGQKTGNPIWSALLKEERQREGDVAAKTMGKDRGGAPFLGEMGEDGEAVREIKPRQIVFCENVAGDRGRCRPESPCEVGDLVDCCCS